MLPVFSQRNFRLEINSLDGGPEPDIVIVVVPVVVAIAVEHTRVGAIVIVAGGQHNVRT